MTNLSFEHPPYFDWSIDRWKVLCIGLLFLVLLLGTLFGADLGITQASSHRQNGPQTVWSEGASLQPSVYGSSQNTQTAVLYAQPTTVSNSAIDTGEAGPTLAGSSSKGVYAGELTQVQLPLTLATIGPNAVVASTGITVLTGTGNTFSRIMVYDQLVTPADPDQAASPSVQERILGMAEVNDRGQWTVHLTDSLAPGQHILSLRELDRNGNITSISSPVALMVLDAGEVGPLSLVTPRIHFPTPAARLRSGPVVFTGSGMPGMRINLFIDGELAAEGIVSSREEWQVATESDLHKGVYLAYVEAIDAEGSLVAASPPVAFSVVEPVEDM